ncbi:MAG: chemotaxis-specific protein-glutamate methyltransferase CheB [Planctomycetota bacterium]|nr:MAG: chemotaxis-specific protein-glutamate methyltransferase CheB [Planctomycetota bacterium]
MIRVAIADDSRTAQELLRSVLEQDRDIRVVGTAADGAEAVEMAADVKPDVILMDVHMPRLNGFEATRRIMAQTPTPIVIVSSTSVIEEARTALRSLEAGALTIHVKPPAPTDPHFDKVSRDLLLTVKAVADVRVVRRRPIAMPDATGDVEFECGGAGGGSRPEVVAIAASTGGPKALVSILSTLPAHFAVPVLVVQHIATGFTQALAQWLDGCTPLAVKLAEHGESLRPGTVYLAPEEAHLGVSAQRTLVVDDQTPAILGFRPSATYLFRSVGEVFGKRALAVILTGMGRDGVEGLQVVKRAGGEVMAQDEQTSVVFGMPAAALSAGVVDRVLPLDGIAECLKRRIGSR